MKAIQAATLSEAWLAALEWLVSRPSGKDVNVAVAFPATAEDPGVRQVVDRFLAARARQRPDAAVYTVDTVAGTLFPECWYRPEHAPEPRQHLYRMQRHAARVHRRITGESETYFDRLVAYPGNAGVKINQLEAQVVRLRGQLRLVGPKSSAYEIGVVEPGDLRVQAPGKDRRYMGFPCLSHISLTLHDGAIHLSALYRNQGFVRKAYGNYVGLSRIARFFARETGSAVGEVTCLASHADAELSVGGRQNLRMLVAACRGALGSRPTREVDRAGT